MAVLNIRHNWMAWEKLADKWKEWDIMVISETYRKAVPWKSRVVPHANEWVEYRTGNDEKGVREKGRKQETKRKGEKKRKRRVMDEGSTGAGGLSIYVRQPIANRVVEVHKCKGGRAMALELEMGKGVRWLLMGVYGYPDRSTEEAKKLYQEVLPDLLRRIKTKHMHVFTVAGDFNVQVDGLLETDMLNTMGWWELGDVATHFNKESPTFWRGGKTDERERLDIVFGCSEMMEAVKNISVGENPFFRTMRKAGNLDHDLIEVELEWLRGHGSRVQRERLRKPKSSETEEWNKFYCREWESTKEGASCNSYGVFEEIRKGAEEVHGRTWTGKSVWGLGGRNKKWMKRHGGLTHFASLTCEDKGSVLLLPGDIFTFEDEQLDYRGRYNKEQWKKVKEEIKEEIKKIGFAGQNFWKKEKGGKASFQLPRWADPKKFWKFVRNQGSSFSIPGVKIDGKNITDTELVKKELHSFYSRLFGGKCPVPRGEWDKLKKWWKKAPLGRDNVLTQEVQWEEFLEAINKKGKAAGWNELVMEHVQFLPIQKKKDVWKWANDIIARG
ncbi:MAG: hypothetical protein GY852_03400, partial [bacterium]|nr:hypothetical protein [bacterium]